MDWHSTLIIKVCQKFFCSVAHIGCSMQFPVHLPVSANPSLGQHGRENAILESQMMTSPSNW
jgi:hypothetical protein